MKKLIFKIFLMAFVAVLFSNCTAKDGETGLPGTDGKDGNANVKAEEQSISKFQWIDINTYRAYATLDFPKITPEIAEKGLVMVYLKYQNNTVWHALPLTISAQTFTESYYFSVEPGKVTLFDDSNDGILSKPEGKIRIVAVSADGKNAPVDWQNYEAVKAHFDLPN